MRPKGRLLERKQQHYKLKRHRHMPISALLFSVLLLIGGNALIGVTTPLRARIEGFPDLTVGLLGSAYFAGLLAGTLAAPAVIRQGGHPRVRRFRRFCAGFRRTHAGLRAAVGLALLPRADRLGFRRDLCGH
jgi:hypothetical protein